MVTSFVMMQFHQLFQAFLVLQNSENKGKTTTDKRISTLSIKVARTVVNEQSYAHNQEIVTRLKREMEVLKQKVY